MLITVRAAAACDQTETLRTNGIWPMWFDRYLRLSAAAFGLSISIASVARAEIIPLADMLRGIPMTATECAASCTPSGRRPTDRASACAITLPMPAERGRSRSSLSPVTSSAGSRRDPDFRPRPNDKDVDTDKLMKRAENLSRTAGTTAIYLARIGVYCRPATTVCAGRCSSSTSSTRRSRRSRHVIASKASTYSVNPAVRPLSQVCLPCEPTSDARLPELDRCPQRQ